MTYSQSSEISSGDFYFQKRRIEKEWFAVSGILVKYSHFEVFAYNNITRLSFHATPELVLDILIAELCM